MASSVINLFILSLIGSTLASPKARLHERAPASCAGEISREGSCIASGGTPFVASLCAEYTPLVTSESTVDSTTTTTETVTTAGVTQFNTPPATATIYVTSTLNVTRINSSLVTVRSGVTTIFPANATTVATEYSTAYTCPASAISIGQKHKRQAAPSPTTTLSTPSCLSSFVFAYGTAGIRNACDCLVSAATGTTTVEVTNTIFATTTTSIIGTTHILPTVTATFANSTTRTVTRYITASTYVPSIATGTRIVTRTTTLTTSLPSPTPSSFYLYYNNTSTNQTYYAHYQESPSITGTLISLSSTSLGDVFSLDINAELVDNSDLGAIAVNNTQDIYPLLYLNSPPTSPYNTPTCSICAGEITCTFPESNSPGEWALCAPQHFLALGPAGSWASNDTNAGADGTCQVITLGVKVVAARPPPSGPGGYGLRPH